jgi:hypothetical protein
MGGLLVDTREHAMNQETGKWCWLVWVDISTTKNNLEIHLPLYDREIWELG